MIISSAPSKPASPISSKVSSSENMKNGPVAASTGGNAGTGGTGGTEAKIAPRERQAGRTAEARGGCYQATRSAVGGAGLDSEHALAALGCRRGRLGCVRRRGPAPVRGPGPAAGRLRAMTPEGFGESRRGAPRGRVTLYTRVGCHLCEEAERVLRREQAAAGFGLELVDVDRDPELAHRYGVRVPVV